jgi:hypothetical protein
MSWGRSESNFSARNIDYDEALPVAAALDDLHIQQRHLCHRGFNLPRVIAAIGPDQFEQGEAPADASQGKAKKYWPAGLIQRDHLIVENCLVNLKFGGWP